MTDLEPHEPRVLQHPEYNRSYQHYVGQGAPPDEAARRAYEWTKQHIASAPAAPTKKSANRVVLAVVVGFIALCGLSGIGAALAGGGDPDHDSVRTADRTEPAPSSTATTTPTAPTSTATSASAAPTSAAAKALAAPSKPRKPGIGAPVRDGKFEFVVKSQKCGVAQVGGEYLNQSAQGQFCLITMTVKNIGDEPRTFDASNHHGFNAAGAKYSADGVASLYLNEKSETFLNEINPGNQVTGTIAFDIPKGAKLTRMELHDSPFSGGVEVSL